MPRAGQRAIGRGPRGFRPAGRHGMAITLGPVRAEIYAHTRRGGCASPLRAPRGGQLHAALRRVGALQVAAGDCFATKLSSSACPQHRLRAGPIGMGGAVAVPGWCLGFASWAALRRGGGETTSRARAAAKTAPLIKQTFTYNGGLATFICSNALSPLLTCSWKRACPRTEMGSRPHSPREVADTHWMCDRRWTPPVHRPGRGTRKRLRVSSVRNADETWLHRDRTESVCSSARRTNQAARSHCDRDTEEARHPPGACNSRRVGSGLGDWRRVGAPGPSSEPTPLDKQERLRSDADLGEHG
jgi:hypothetical protein